MLRTEPLSLYNGLSASLLREGSYSAIRFGLYDICKEGVAGGLGWSGDGFGAKLVGGLISGMIGACIANPADLVSPNTAFVREISLAGVLTETVITPQLKVRMQSASSSPSSPALTLRGHTSSIIHKEGIRGLYRAVWPTTVRAGILTSSQLGVYDHAKYT